MSLCVQLTHLGAIKFTGADAQKYLQGQITSDISLLDEDSRSEEKKVQFSCQCDSKGKTLSTFYIVKWRDGYLLIGYRESLNLSLAAFKKFAVFSQVNIEDLSESLNLYGLDANAASAGLALPLLPELPMTVTADDNSLIFRIQGETARYVFLSTENTPKCEISGDLQDWIAADITGGIPHISGHASGDFVPQMLNLQSVDAISFTKGCYMGQETVARAKYLGKNKRAAYILTGHANTAPDASELIEMQLGENWRRGGAIAYSAFNKKNQKISIYAVLPNDTEADKVLRLKSQPDTLLRIESLPYTVE